MKKTIEMKKAASVNEAIEIINRLNYRNDTFEYHGYTREDNADIKYRHFDGYKENGEPDGFSLIEIVVGGKLEVVRFFNHFRNITVDIKLGDFNLDYSRYDEVIDADAKIESNAEVESNDAEAKAEPKMTITTNDERRFQVTVHYKANDNGIIADGMNGTTTATAEQAANWIITFAEENSSYTVTEFNIRDCETFKKYRSNDADLQALNHKNEITAEEQDAFQVAVNTEIQNATKPAKKNYSINPHYDEDSDVKFNHVDIYTNDGSISISGFFECKNIETAYRRFRKIVATIPLLDGWDFIPANKLTKNVNGWENENGDQVFFNDPLDSLAIDQNEDLFYIYGKFTTAESEADNNEIEPATTELENSLIAAKAQLADLLPNEILQTGKMVSPEPDTTPQVDPIITGIKEEKTNREKLLALRKDYIITDHLSANNSFLWYINGKRSSRVKVWNLLQSYGLTIAEFLAEDEAYINECVAASCKKIAIKKQADFLYDKIKRDAQPSNDNVFDLLPNLDELNDLSADPYFMDDDAEYTERDARFNYGERYAAALTEKLSRYDPTVEVTYDIGDDDEDVYYLKFDGIYRSRYTLSGVESAFHRLKKDIAEEEFMKNVDGTLDDKIAALHKFREKQIA